MLELITPNFSLMRHPGNWLIVGFTLLIVIAASHVLFGRNIAIKESE